MTTKRKLTLFSLLFAGSLFFMNCESDTPKPKDDEANKKEQTDVPKEDESNKKEFKKIFYAIPSPVEMVSLIKQSGSNYDESLMNPTSNAKSYSSIREQALNLGVYGADIAYASMFDQNQASIKYMSSIQNLTNSLGLSSVLDKDLLDRINENKENKDSLLVIVSEAFWNFNGYLKEEQREDIAALVIAGGWVEGLHLGLSHCNDNTDEPLSQRIAEQKYSLDNLNALIDSYKSDQLGEIKSDLKKISDVYDKVTITKIKGENKINADGVFEINSINEISMSPETLEELKMTVEEIRTNYIK